MKQMHEARDYRLDEDGPAFASYAAFESYLDSLGLFRMTPGLERMHRMLARLGLARPPFFAVQVVGTNGKGSTSTMLAQLALRHGLKTGLCTSPHFLSVRERIRVDGAALCEGDWIALASTLMRHGGGELSYFEFVTCLAALAFAEQGVAFAVLETGLGGAYDATTAVEADMAVYTPIGLDHQSVLGSTIAHIAADKAEAIREGKPVISAAQCAEAEEALRRIAGERNAPLCFAGAVEDGDASRCLVGAIEGGDAVFAPEEGGGIAALDEGSLLLAGEHQVSNARLALAAWRAARDLLPEKTRKTVGRAVREHGGVLDEKPGALLLTPLQWHDDPLMSPNDALRRSAETRGFGGNHFPRAEGRGRGHRLCAAAPGAHAISGLEGRALREAWLPGRMQCLAPAAAGEGAFPCALGWPSMLLDGAHNAHGLAALGLSLARKGVAPGAVVFSCLEDKDLDDMIPLLRALATGPIFVPPVKDNPRVADPVELAGCIGLNAVPVSSLEEALRAAATHMAERLPEAFAAGRECRNPLLLCGSLYLLGEFFALRPECLNGPEEL